ncbi:chromosome condensation (RCC1) repeat [Rhizoctonia solani]|uniref:Chromosome condensation (RCC1) repeat n=1 Tax=Rhizoctonia solani TaxID=456999 RepID=A0A8H7ID17_9AGAM|nr:chromosome condensation (RCC1) repeat [Rhizoctonia solani]
MARPKSSTKAAAASMETKKATTSKPRASATKLRQPKSKGAASKAAAEPKKAPTRGRKRAPDDEPASSAPAKPTKKAKADNADTAAETAAEETAAEETAAEEEATKEKEETAQESTQPEPETEAPKPKVNGVKKTDSLLSNSSRRRGQPPNPSRLILVFGNGDSSQFGMGPNATGEYPRPRMQKFFKTASDEGKLGGEGAGVESLAAGGLHTLAIDEAGKVWTWGTNDDGALGRLVEGPDPEDPSKTIDSDVAESTPTVLNTLAEEQFRAVSVAAGNNVSLALGTNGQLRAWGSFRSNEGAFGFDGRPGSARIQYLPTTLEALTKDVFVQIACEQFQLGRKVLERHKKRGLFPEKLHLRNIVSIGCGAYHSFASTRRVLSMHGDSTSSASVVSLAKKIKFFNLPLYPHYTPTFLATTLVLFKLAVETITRYSLPLMAESTPVDLDRLSTGHRYDHPAIVNPDDEEEAKFAMSEPVLVPFPPPPTADKLDPDVDPMPKRRYTLHAHPLFASRSEQTILLPFPSPDMSTAGATANRANLG